MIVNLPGKDRRVRKTLSGRGAVDDTLIVPVTLELFLACVGGESMDAQDDYDEIVDDLNDLIRANPTMASPPAKGVWSAGEFAAGVTHDQTQPYGDEDGLTVFINGAVRFEAWQWIAKNVVPVD